MTESPVFLIGDAGFYLNRYAARSGYERGAEAR